MDRREERRSPCPPGFSIFNTEHTEPLSDLCVRFFRATEGTKALVKRGQISAAREEAADYRCGLVIGIIWMNSLICAHRKKCYNVLFLLIY
jgi:hypothetical protein